MGEQKNFNRLFGVWTRHKSTRE